MIPKLIHYCWFGKNPKPEDVLKNIESWKKFCPDYEIKEWNESNFDINCCDYVREAYEAQKWAFVSDYVRLKVLVDYGGIYMDTDVEVIKKIDFFLTLKAFSGFEDGKKISTGIMGAEKGNPVFKEFLSDYSNRHFLLQDGTYNQTTNVEYITTKCLKYGLKPNNSYQQVSDFTLFPKDYFCPKDYATGEIILTDNTYTIHHFSGTWMSEEEKQILATFGNMKKKYGNTLGKILAYFFTLKKRAIFVGLKKAIIPKQ